MTTRYTLKLPDILLDPKGWTTFDLYYEKVNELSSEAISLFKKAAEELKAAGEVPEGIDVAKFEDIPQQHTKLNQEINSAAVEGDNYPKRLWDRRELRITSLVFRHMSKLNHEYGEAVKLMEQLKARKCTTVDNPGSKLRETLCTLKRVLDKLRLLYLCGMGKEDEAAEFYDSEHGVGSSQELIKEQAADNLGP